MSEFELYPEERHWWSFNDHRAVMSVMRRLKPKRVLEFGPGSSTLALVEGGAQKIDTCEDDPDWAGVYEERLAKRFPGLVSLHRYIWSDPLTVPTLARTYDLALVDGPLGTLNRPAVVDFCLSRCKAVLVPTEDCGSVGPALRPQIERLVEKHRRKVEWMETGPLSGGFALVTRR